MEYNSTKASQSESGNQINNYDEFKQIKKSGIQRRQKLLAMKQSGTQNSSMNSSSILIEFQRENQQKEEILMNQQNNAKKKKIESQVEPAYQIENAEVNFETIQQELLNISTNNKSGIMTDRKFKQGGQIVLDKQLLDQAKPLFQRLTEMDLDINDPKQLPKCQQSIQQYRVKKQDLILLSENISSKVKRNDTSQNRTNNNKANEVGFYQDNSINYSLEQFDQNNKQLQSPFESFFTKQEESIRQKAINKFQEKNSNKQGEREEDLNYYPDTLEDQKFQNVDQKRRADPLAKQFDFTKLNSPKKWQKQQQNKQQKPLKNQRMDSLLEQYYYDENSENLIDQIKDIPDYYREEESNVYIPNKNSVNGLLLPQMYQGNLLKLPSQLQKDHYETYLGGFTQYKSQQQKLQNEMIFNQISPLAREAFRNINQIENQYTNQPSSRKIEALATPKVKNFNILNEDPQFSPEEINFDTILNIVSDGIPQDQLNQLVSSQKNQNIKENYFNQNGLDNSKQYESQGKNNTSQEIANFKHMLHSQGISNNSNNLNNNINNINNNNSNNFNNNSNNINSISNNNNIINSINGRNNNIAYEQPIQDYSNNYKQQNDRVLYDKEKDQKQVFDQSIQYENNLSTDRIKDAVIEKEVQEFQYSNQNQQIQQVPKVDNIKQQNPSEQSTPQVNQDTQMQKKQIEQILSDITQLQNSRNNPNISEMEEERLISILKVKLNDLIEFIKYDSYGNDLFGDVTQQSFLESFPQNVEKIKGQTIGSFSKMLLLYKYFENYLPLVQHTSSQQQINQQNKSSPEVLMKHLDYSKVSYGGANTERQKVQQNRNENNNILYSKSPNRNGVNQGVTFSNKVQTLQQQNRVPAGRINNNKNSNNYQSPAKQSAKNQRNAALTSQLKTYQNISSKVNTGLDKSAISYTNNSKNSMNQTTQIFSPASKKSNYSIRNTAGSTTNKSFSNVVSPSNSNSTRKGGNSNNQSNKTLTGYSKQNSQNLQQQNRSLSNKRAINNNPNSARTLPGKQTNQEIKPSIRQSKVNRSEDFSQKQFFNNNGLNKYNDVNEYNKYSDGNGYNKYNEENSYNKFNEGNGYNKYNEGNGYNKYNDGNGQNDNYYDQYRNEQQLVMMNNYNNFDNYSYEEQ